MSSDTVSLPQIVVLAGGLGTRLGAIAQGKPKAMVELAGAPFVDHQLKLLKSAGFSKVLMCVAHKSEMIAEHVGDGSRFGLQVSYSFDGAEPLGTGGAIKNAGKKLDNVFAIIYGDTYLDIDYVDVYRSFLAAGHDALMTVLANDNKWGKSNVKLRGQRVALYDKNSADPDVRYIDYGLSFIHRNVVLGLPKTQFDLSDVFQPLISEGQLMAYEVCQRFYELNTPESLAETAEYLLSDGT